MSELRSVSQREMRNQSGELLRRVADGESVMNPNNATPAAILDPAAPPPPLPRAAAGRLSVGTGLDLSLLPAPRPCRTATQDLLDADRGQ